MRLVAIREALFHSELDHPQRHVAAHERIAAASAEVERVEAMLGSSSAKPRRFVLNRLEDASGVSGVGVVAEGVQFTDGACVIRWTTQHTSAAFYADLATLEAIHGHGGRTVVAWVD